MRVATRYGQGWATTGVEADGGTPAWWDGLRDQVRRLEKALAAAGRASDDIARYLSVDSGGYALESVDRFEDAVGRARELGFTDVVTHWPRRDGIYAGSETVLEEVASRLDALRG
jgi:hypothetical protein